MVKLGDIIEIMIDYPDCAGVKTGDILEVVEICNNIFSAQDQHNCVWQLSLRNENLHFEVVPTIPVPAPNTISQSPSAPSPKFAVGDYIQRIPDSGAAKIIAIHSVYKLYEIEWTPEYPFQSYVGRYAVDLIDRLYELNPNIKRILVSPSPTYGHTSLNALPRGSALPPGVVTSNPFMNRIADGTKNDGHLIPIIYIPSSGYNQPKCECGAEKTYGIGTRFHSDWCPRYEPQTK